MSEQSHPQVARRNHYVSVGYLALFTNTGTSKGELCCADVETERFFHAKPKHVAFELDFNRIESDKQAPDALETALGSFESRAIRVVRDICKTGKLPDMKTFSYVYNLITLFAVRNPVLRAAADASQRRGKELILEFATSSEDMYAQQIEGAKRDGFIPPDLDVPYEKARDSVRKTEHLISIPREQHVDREFRVIDKVLNLVAHKHWSLMTAETGAPDLITCDRPAPTQLGLPIIVFTISPRHALMGSQELIAPAEFDIDSARVGRINTQLFRQANKHIYSRKNNATFIEGSDLITCNLEEGFLNRGS